MSNVLTLETESFKFWFVKHTYGPGKGPCKKVRVYAPYVEPEMEMPVFGIKGQDAENDKAWHAYNREEVRLMKTELNRALVEARAAAELGDEGAWAAFLAAMDSGVKFSKTAGCSCGCSKGFVANTMVRVDGYFLDQISVSHKEVAPKPERTYTFADFDLVNS